MKNEFLKHYQIGCWYYWGTTFGFPYDPVEVQKDLGFTYFTTPEHWRDTPQHDGVKNLEKYLNKARELNMPTLYVDRKFFGTRKWAKADINVARQKVKLMKEKYPDVVKGFYVCDEPWWGHTDDHKAINICKDYVDMIREEHPDAWTYIALLGVNDRYEKGKAELVDYIERVKPDFLLYNVYSQLMDEDCEKEQGMINFYYQLYMYYEVSREYNLPLWSSPLCTAVWCFREPTEDELRWQLNVLAAHGVKGFVWYHLHELKNASQSGKGSPIDYMGNKTHTYNWIKHANNAFKDDIISKLEGFELEDVYHYMFRQSNFKAWEFVKDDVIEDVRSPYHRHLIISKFKDDKGRYRIMVTNGSQNKNGRVKITFKGDYAKYNVTGESGYLSPGGAKIISLFDEPSPLDLDPIE